VRIELSDPARGTDLRDYLLRNGAVAAVDSGGAVEVEVAANAEAALDRWIEQNPGTWARVITFSPRH
jgi:nicotinamidase-related amidase